MLKLLLKKRNSVLIFSILVGFMILHKFNTLKRKFDKKSLRKFQKMSKNDLVKLSEPVLKRPPYNKEDYGFEGRPVKLLEESDGERDLRQAIFG